MAFFVKKDSRMSLTVDLDEHLIEVPAQLAKPTYARDTLPPDIDRKWRSKVIPPQPHRPVPNVYSALEQQILDVAQR